MAKEMREGESGSKRNAGGKTVISGGLEATAGGTTPDTVKCPPIGKEYWKTITLRYTTL